MKVILCEKQNQGQDIAACLGLTGKATGFVSDGKTTVTWASGHLLTLGQPADYGESFNKWGLKYLPIIPGHNDWIINPSPNPYQARQLGVVGQILKKATSVIIATDIDREGEMIGRELLEYFNYKGPIERLWISSLDNTSIRNGFASLRKGHETEKLYHAAMGRSRADWLVGMNFSRAFSASVGAASGYGNLALGRVQTPTLAIVVAQDLKIEQFVPKPFFTVTGRFSNQKGGLTGTWQTPDDLLEDGYCLKKSDAEKVVSDCQNSDGRVTLAQTKKKSEKAPLPFDLTTLQQFCNRRWSLSGDETLAIAQKLYDEYKLTTYPRVDCRYLETAMEDDIPKLLQATAMVNPELAPAVKAADPSMRTAVWDDSKTTAHHAIIPNVNNADPKIYARMTDMERKVYDLIVSHYLAQFYPVYEYNSTVIEIECQGHIFKVTGRVPLNRGWKEVIASSKSDDAEELPSFSVGDIVTSSDLEVHSKQTKPPPRMTEDSLLGAMQNVHKLVDDKESKAVLKEVLGIGTSATRASIIKGLIEKGFLQVVKKKELHSTQRARMLIGLLPDILTSPMMTAKWERELAKIEDGSLTLSAFMEKQDNFIVEIVDRVKSGEFTKGITPAHPCPTCGNALSRRKRKAGGFFWSCMSYPECTTALPDDNGKPGKARPAPKPTGKDCKRCDGKLFERVSKAGKPFYSCGNYPACDYAEWPIDPKTITDDDCPKCKSTKLLKLMSAKKKPYLKCQSAECDYFGFPDDPATRTGKTCPRCNNAELQIRTIKKGKRKGETFKGCGGYPACDYTEWDN